MFAKVVSCHTDWNPCLSYIAFAYNSTVQKSEAVLLSRVTDITYIVQLTRTKQKRVVHVDKLKLWRRAAAATGSDNESAPVV
jgi:hypothetical protein